MEFVDSESIRLLAYVQETARHGHVLTVREFDVFAETGKPQDPVPLGKLMAGLVGSQLVQGLVAASQSGETKLEWMDRLGWLSYGQRAPGADAEKQEEVVRITNLGRAVLAAGREGDREVEIPAQIALTGDDPIARARVIERLAAVGPGALVDRYFGAEDLLAIVQETKLDRILTGPSESRGRLAGLRAAMNEVSLPREIEIRVDAKDEFHDRFAIPQDGPVWAIGTSLGGVGRRNSVMIELGDSPTATAIRNAFDECWASAKVVNAQSAPDEDL